MKVILTQDEKLVNFDNVMSITTLVGEYGDNQAYALVAQPYGVDDEDFEHWIQLGIYETEEKAAAVFLSMQKCIRDNVKSLFEMPLDVEEK
ncbi:MAG: hypothetical protein LUI06_00445 [Ruminococcus sp.]|nr:hypothetical protein [Ruminococcus sp.]